MRDGGEIVDDDANSGVRAEVLYVPFFGVAEISLIGEEQDRIVVIDAETDVAERPEKVSSFIHEEIDVKLFGCGWGRGGCDGKVGDGFVKGIVRACSWIGDVPRGAGGCEVGVGFVIVDCCHGVRLVGE